MKLENNNSLDVSRALHQWFVREDLTLTKFLKEVGSKPGDLAEVNKKPENELFSDVLKTLKKINQ